MARYNEILAGRFNKALSKLFSMKGDPPAPTLAGELTAVLPLFYGRESRTLEGWNTFGGGFIVAAVAANVSLIQLLNPSNSNVIAIIEKMSFAAVNAAVANVVVNFGTGVGLAGLTNVPLTNYGLDIRGAVTPNSTLATKNNTATTATGIVAFTSQTLANQGLDVIVTEMQELPMPPGTFYQFSPGTSVNTAVGINLLWRERPLEPSELFQ